MRCVRVCVCVCVCVWCVCVCVCVSGVLPFSSHNGKLMQIAAGIRTKPARDLEAITHGRVSQVCVTV